MKHGYTAHPLHTRGQSFIIKYDSALHNLHIHLIANGMNHIVIEQ